MCERRVILPGDVGAVFESVRDVAAACDVEFPQVVRKDYGPDIAIWSFDDVASGYHVEVTAHGALAVSVRTVSLDTGEVSLRSMSIGQLGLVLEDMVSTSVFVREFNESLLSGGEV